MPQVEIRHFHLFAGLGGGAKGFNMGEARVGSVTGRFRCLGGIDVDPRALADFHRLAGVPGTLLDLFTRGQYRAFHGHEPPREWREATADDIRRAAQGERPHIVFASPPCKAFSGLLTLERSLAPRYQALNALTLRGTWLALEAWRDDPPEFFLLENVPLLQVRGRHLLDQISAMLRAYGYAVAETTHDCGKLGGLAQTRKRFLLVARHTEKVPPFLYVPESKPLRSVGSLLGKMPLPGDARGGPMHRVPSLAFKTWLRLAFVKAGSDWRSLGRLAVEDGWLRDYVLVPEMHNGTVAFSVADPRFFHSDRWNAGQQYGVHRWTDTVGTITGQQAPGQGRFAVADPRLRGVRHNNIFRVMHWQETSTAVTGGTGPTAGGLAVADPRPRTPLPASTVVAAGTAANAAATVASARACDWQGLPSAEERLVVVIRSEDGTWHRPFTTLELACLQGLLEPEEYLELDGLSDSAWRERIGNAVPPPAAQAIAGVMGRTLLLAWSGETFTLDSQPVWVRPIIAALSVAQAGA